jgi:hypothetical protein
VALLTTMDTPAAATVADMAATATQRLFPRDHLATAPVLLRDIEDSFSRNGECRRQLEAERTPGG